MKKLLIILILSPIITFSQISSWRNSGNRQHTMSPVKSSSKPSSNESQWRPSPFTNRGNVIPYNSTGRLHNNVFYSPYFGRDRWDLWGAPYHGWSYWEPSFYMNRWGYREPSRVYVYIDGKRDTILGKKLHYSFGVQGSANNQIGFWGTVGNKGYFIFEINKTRTKDNSTYFPYGRIQDVDFNMTSDLEKISSLYVGGGKKFSRTGFHVMIGLVNENVRYRGYDKIGYITFPKYADNYFNIKIGMLHDFKNITTKIDADLINKDLILGIGFNL